jgi:DNA-binding response OmpR family regulator
MRILVVADGKNSRSGELIDILNRNGNHASSVSSEHLTQEIIVESDIVVIDRGLPYHEGVAICQRIRIDSDVPILMLSDRPDQDNHESGPRSWVDTYVATPRSLNDILAKIVAVARPKDHGRMSARPEAVRIGDMTIGIKNMKVTVGDKTVELTKKEFQILALIATEEGFMCSREKIAAEAWGLPESDVYDSIHVLVSRLRTKLGHERIRTVRSIGYQLVAAPDPTR